ncbi:MAG: hypothetical protein L0I24_09260, partial [Pseudonocardia sp.]|nr:hypothetical protein [Pseudonocardia sp.]
MRAVQRDTSNVGRHGRADLRRHRAGPRIHQEVEDALAAPARVGEHVDHVEPADQRLGVDVEAAQVELVADVTGEPRPVPAPRAEQFGEHAQRRERAVA